MAAEPWTRGADVKVRIGIHTGEAELAAGVYVGIDVHRAARIMAAAHGGQILVSEATRALVSRSMPAGASLRDLGEHQLKDLPEPERLYQVNAEGLEADFPAAAHHRFDARTTCRSPRPPWSGARPSSSSWRACCAATRSGS